MLSKQWGFISAKDATSVLLFARSARLKVQEDKRSSRVIWYWSDLSDLFSVSCSDHDLSFFLSWVYFHPSIHHSTLVSSGAFKMHIVTSTIKQIYKLKACFFCLFVFVFLQKLQGKIANCFFFPKWGVTILHIVTKKHTSHQMQVYEQIQNLLNLLRPTRSPDTLLGLEVVLGSWSFLVTR